MNGALSTLMKHCLMKITLWIQKENPFLQFSSSLKDQSFFYLASHSLLYFFLATNHTYGSVRKAPCCVKCYIDTVVGINIAHWFTSINNANYHWIPQNYILKTWIASPRIPQPTSAMKSVCFFLLVFFLIYFISMFIKVHHDCRCFLAYFKLELFDGKDLNVRREPKFPKHHPEPIKEVNIISNLKCEVV